MAQFPAEILLTANNKGVLNKINEIERALNTFEQKSKKLVIQDEASARFFRQKLDYLKQQNLQLKIAEDRTKRIAQQTAATTKSLQKRVGAAAGGGLIGAGFPALFGASKGEIVGGGVGGILGGVVGGQTGAFTGSIVGSAIGKITQARAEVKQLSEELGFSAKQAEVLEEAFESAGLKGAESFEKTVTKVSGSGLELNDQISVIKAATELSRVYRGEVSKIAGAFTDVLLKGKVAVSDLNKLQSQGIPIQEALAKKLGVSRTELLQLTKDGEVSVQTLADEFINLGNNAKDAPDKAKGEFDELTDALLDAAAGVGTLATNLLRILKPAIEQLTKDITGLINKLNELVRAGPVGDLQREITGGKIKDFTTFGATPDTVLNLENALKNVTAEGLKSKDAIDAVELSVARAARRSQEFKGKAGELAEKTVQPQITRLQKEIATARKVLKSVETTNKQLPNITVPADLDTSDSGGSSGGSAAQSEELRLRQQILTAELAVREVERERAALQSTKLDAARAEESALRQNLGVEIEILELERQQALATSKVPEDNVLINKLYDERLQKLLSENALLQERSRSTQQELQLQKELTALRNEQQTAGIVQGLERNIEDAKSFGSSEALTLRIQQLRRQEDLIGGINDKIREQEKIEAGGNAEQSAQATQEIKDLKDRKAAIKALLPALNQAEQQQLRFNQAFAAVSPAVNSLVGGLREVIAGTKSAEQAFADFLNTIADQLVNTAATLIAQYIAIGIARKFAGLPPAGDGGSGPGTAGLPRITNQSDLFNGSIPFFGTSVPSFFADGGRPPVGETSIVGERGPELFVPDRPGTIVPNEFFDAARQALQPSGGNISDSSDTSEAFAAATAAIERNTTNIVNRQSTVSQETSFNNFAESLRSEQRQPIRFETVRVGEIDMVTKDEALKIGADSARAAEASVFSALKNKPSVRRSIGMS